ncbi:hypothetical protein [Tenacibaculum sp. M341]|uniref:hypothetical protein n=1 Tax=Tenacibaculum sp. M341 TaxID=2530339 RepID=UPI0010521F83|nr:hypothetical protein [Tenacibaculum sp. M341]TCI93692.1 hypothetical protein EYW44_04560 [Tenacibaculum sp. M341]
MKASVDILKSWFQTGDKPTETQFANLIDSFHHKDDGQIITSYKLFANGNLSLTFSDGITANIQRFALPNTMPLNFIEGLIDALNEKVTKQSGKDLSDENFTLELRQKLEELENYVHPDFHKIEEIEGLQILLESKMDRDGLKQLTDENFTLEEKEKLADLENYTPPSSQPISYIETLQDTLDLIDQNIDNKVDKEDGKGLSSNDFTNEEKDKLSNLNQATGLERVVENGNAGWRLSGQSADNYGDIGQGAVDISFNSATSTLHGATGKYAYAQGESTTASGVASHASGHENTAHSYSETAIGSYGTNYTAKSAESFDGADRVFNIGNGVSDASRSDALTILKSGQITVPSTTKDLIEKGGAKSIITKEYADQKYANSSQVVFAEVDLGGFNTDTETEIKAVPIFQNPVKNSLIIPTQVSLVGNANGFTDYLYDLSLGFSKDKNSASFNNFHNINLGVLGQHYSNSPYIISMGVNMIGPNLEEYQTEFTHSIYLVGDPKKVVKDLNGKLLVRIEYFTLENVIQGTLES